jgi:hypothetical protein
MHGTCLHATISKNYLVLLHCIQIRRTNGSKSDATGTHLGKVVIVSRFLSRRILHQSGPAESSLSATWHRIRKALKKAERVTLGDYNL